ncbi:helix-turn-helix domain-containing protein [Amycolatopsis cihanbeyliensis]|uniref:Helix-turn-helix domain-containing protein n=1 Tax=Amycolatopsis cihanbeyliensis TaxID=1128664 RepID=A0A542DE83_AMYCI|nr:helix-turn-helix domain-containing protein [Amycolatopsis cihanbeyliensis]TQJ01388.1 hypothetical protein FB471_1066 [Amycolatopsis cihanbeyliensis]
MTTPTKATAERVRFTGPERTELAEELKRQYEQGDSIRALADSCGRSYGFVHRLLTEARTTLRSRGGSRPGND